MLAALYARASRDRTGEAATVERQERECRALAAKRGWEIADVFVDNDLSAFGGKPRPEYRRMLAAIKSGAVDAVVTYHPDRLYRRLVDLEELITVVEARRVQVATVSAGDVDLGTPAGRASARIIGTMARYESEQKGERHRSKHRELAEQGRWHGGGRRRFGYDVDRSVKPNRLVINRAEAKLLRKAADDVLNGASLNSIARRWNEAGARTTGDRRWTLTDVRRILLSPHVAGKRVHRATGAVTDATWPAILTPATRALLLARFSGRETPRGRQTQGRRYALTGLLFCALCGTRMSGRSRSGKAWAYVCSPGAGGCAGVAVTGWRLDDHIMGQVATRQSVGPPNVAPSTDEPDPERESLLATLAHAEARIAQIDADYATGDITAKELRAAKDAIDRTRREAESRLADMMPVRVTWDYDSEIAEAEAWHGRLVGGELSAAEASDAHDWVAAYVERIDVRPASKRGARFDSSRVSVTWRE